MTSRRPPLILVVPAAAAALISVAPVWYLLDRTLDGGFAKVSEELWQRRTFDLLARSLALSAAVTIACVLVGVIGAFVVTRRAMPGARVAKVLLTLPLAIPSYLASFAWVSFRPDWAGFPGAVLVLTSVSFPYVLLPVSAALQRVDPALEDVARSLGFSRRAVAVKVVLPQIRTSIAAGALLVALYVLSDFGAVAAMRYEVFTWVIYSAYRAGFDPARAAILASALVVVATCLVVAESSVRGRAASRLGPGTVRRPHMGSSSSRWGGSAVAAWGFVLAITSVALVFPLWRIGVWLSTYTSTDIDWGDVGATLGTTLGVATLAGLVTIALAFPVGALAARSRTRFAAICERATFVAHALPGIVVAISLVFLGVRLLRPIYQEMPLLILGYAVLFLPLAVGAVRTSVEMSPLRLDEVAHSLGKRPTAVLTRVTAPLALPGIAAGLALVMVSVMKELPVTLILHPTGTETLATSLWAHTSVSDYANAGPYALALVLFAAVPAAVLGVVNDRRGGAEVG